MSSRPFARSILAVMLLAACLPASEIDGIWVGQQQGRRGEPEDLAFRFKLDGQVLTGKMFGDEFDLPISDGSFSGDQIRFVVTTTNYYNGTKTRFVYLGAIKNGEMELTRERIQTADEKAANRNPGNVGKQTLKLKRFH
jgi:hypothetical protein